MTIDFSYLRPGCEDGPCDSAATTHYMLPSGTVRHVCEGHRVIYLQEQAWKATWREGSIDG